MNPRDPKSTSRSPRPGLRTLAVASILLLFALGLGFLLGGGAGPAAIGTQDGTPAPSPPDPRSSSRDVRAATDADAPAPRSGIEVAAAPIDAAATTASLTVHLRRRIGGAPVPGIRVFLFDPSLGDLERVMPIRREADAAGDAHFTGLHPGDQVVRVASQFTGARVVAGVANETTMLLDRLPVLQGKVVERGKGPVAGAEIVLVPDADDDELRIVAHSDRDGRFGPLFGNNDGALLARKQGYTLSAADRHFTFDGDTKELELVLDRAAASCDVVAVDEIGRAVGGAEIAVIDLDAPPPAAAEWSVNRKRSAIAAADGHARFDDLRKGKARVYARAGGMAPATSDVDLDAGSECSIVLHRGATLIGTARYADGTALAGASLTVTLPSPWPRARTTVDGDGRFEISGLPHWNAPPEWGEGSAHLAAKDGARAQLELDFGDLDYLEWNVVLDRPGRLRGQVVDEAGHGLHDLYVECTWGSEAMQAAFAWTDADGNFDAAVDRTARIKVGVQDLRTPWTGALASITDQPSDGPPLRIVVPSAKRASAYVTAKLVRPAGFENAMLRVLALPVPLEQARPLDLCGVGRDGELLLGPLRPGTLTIETIGLDSPFPRRQIATAQVESDQTVDLGEIRLARPAVLTLVPVLDGSPEAPALKAHLLDAMSHEEVAEFEYEQGRTTCRQAIEPGTYLLRVDAGADHAALEVRCELFDGIDNRVDLPLKRPVKDH